MAEQHVVLQEFHKWDLYNKLNGHAMTLYRSYSVWFRTSRLDETSLPMALSMGEIRAAAAEEEEEEEDGMGTRCPPLAPLTAPSHCLPI